MNMLNAFELALKRGIRIFDVATELGIEINSMNDYLNGKAEPSNEILQKIADKLMVSVEELTFQE